MPKCAILMLACVLAASGRSATGELPNIVLLMGDDHGWNETGYNGHPHVRTPVLDEMAATGLRLDRFYAASPVCSPTRGSVMTGRHPNRYGTFAANWSIRPDEISIASILGEAGYACGHFGKWHLGPVNAASPTCPGAMGFETWLSHDNFFEMNPTLSHDGQPPEKFAGEGSEVVVDAAIRFIGLAQNEGRPFLAVVWFGSPHEPYSARDSDLALYDELPDSYQERLVSVTSMETGMPVRRPLGRVLRERYAEITAMDRAIGRLRRYLEQEGLRQKTLLWYCGDNGVPASGRVAVTLRGEKGFVYEGGIRVPGIIEWPERIDRPRVTEVNAVTSDILPTICELVGLDVPQRPLDGVSLKSLIDNEMTQRSRPICFWNYDLERASRSELEPYIDPRLQEGTTPLVKLMDGRLTRSFRNFHYRSLTEKDLAGPRAVLDHRFKLVVDGTNSGELELFDVRDDPTERHNLVDVRPEIVRRLQQELRQWQDSVIESLIGSPPAHRAE